MLLIALNDNKNSLEKTEVFLRSNCIQDILHVHRDKEEIKAHKWNANEHLRKIIGQSSFVNGLVASLTTKQFLKVHGDLRKIEND